MALDKRRNGDGMPLKLYGSHSELMDTALMNTKDHLLKKLTGTVGALKCKIIVFKT